MKTRKSFIVLGIVALCALLFPVWAAAGGQGEAADYPTKKITYIIPFNPGGQSDITAQFQRKPLKEVLGVDIILKHMPGAGGAVA